MATYFHGNPEIQAEGLQTLVLMNPTYVQYASDTSPQQLPHNNILLLNPAASAVNNHHLPGASTQQLVGIPLEHNIHENSSTQHGLFAPRVHYNLYNPISTSSPTALDTPRAQRALSLSLSSQQQRGFMSVSGSDQDHMRLSGGSVSSGSGLTNNAGAGFQGALLGCKYLKAAQELLDEVVSVNSDGIKTELSKKGSCGNSIKVVGEESGGTKSGSGDGDGSSEKRGPELISSERQEIQLKKAKLINMLDEVEQRYRQYHNQMQIIISSFEQVAGVGSDKTYTALALQTISRQFRCLKDVITGQIKAANKSLGEEDFPGGKIEGSRLKFVDHHYRQQRTLQQLGMIQHNAWRPQRGLPERSVSVLRAWLFEHFLHPYPKDSDKHMLAKQTGLTRSQVSNWFINARVRLWKPMVEDMYMEEIKEHEKNSGSKEKASKSDQNEDDSALKSVQLEKSSVTNSLNQGRGFNSLIGSSELAGITDTSPKKPRNNNNEVLESITSVASINMDFKAGEENNEHVNSKFGTEKQGMDSYSFGGHTNFIEAFGQYPIGEIGRYTGDQFAPRFAGNGVSLTLGLQHCENLSLSGSQHQSFLPNQNIQLGRRVELSNPNQFGATPVLESIDIQNRKGRFNQVSLLPDYVS